MARPSRLARWSLKGLWYWYSCHGLVVLCLVVLSVAVRDDEQHLRVRATRKRGRWSEHEEERGKEGEHFGLVLGMMGSLRTCVRK